MVEHGHGLRTAIASVGGGFLTGEVEFLAQDGRMLIVHGAHLLKLGDDLLRACALGRSRGNTRLSKLNHQHRDQQYNDE